MSKAKLLQKLDCETVELWGLTKCIWWIWMQRVSKQGLSIELWAPNFWVEEMQQQAISIVHQQQQLNQTGLTVEQARQEVVSGLQPVKTADLEISIFKLLYFKRLLTDNYLCIIVLLWRPKTDIYLLF